MEEKEKLERGEIVEKKPEGSSPSERTPTTAEAQQPPETEGQELTAENCEAKLADLKAELDQTAPLARDTSFDRLEQSKRRLDGVFNSGPWNQWDQWDGWNPNPPPPPAPSGPPYQQFSGQDGLSHSYETGTGHSGHSGLSSQYRSVRGPPPQLSQQQTSGTCRGGRTLQRQDASAYQEERYHPAGLYDGPGSHQERYWQNGFSHPKPLAGPQYGGPRNGYGARRRLPCETFAKKTPWHTMVTGWSSDDLAKPGSSQYNGGGVLANGYAAHRLPPDHSLRQGRQLPMVPSTKQSKVLLNQRSLPEDFSDSYMRETHSAKLTSYLRPEPFQHSPSHKTIF